MAKYFKETVVIILIIFIAGLSIYKRNAQYSYWLKHKNIYFTDQYPSVTTLDAYYWLRQARYEVEGRYDGKQRYFLNTYPDTKGNILKKPPFISFILAKFYKFFNSDGYNHIYVGSIKLINILASLFIIPLIFICYNLGYLSAGVLGSLIATFSWAYYPRSFTGRIDTDSLLLFFPFLAILLTILIDKVKKFQIQIILAALTGATLNLYAQWHGAASSFNFIYSLLFLFFLFIHKKEKKDILILFIVFIIFYNPLKWIYGINGVLGLLESRYFAFLHAGSNLQLPDIIKTITETQKKNTSEIINMIYAITPLFYIGLLGVVAFFIKTWKKSFLFFPLFFLGLTSFVSSNRFALFLAPFIGMGIGFVIDFIVILLKKFFVNLNSFEKITIIISPLIAISIFWFTKSKTGYNIIPSPSIDRATISSFIKLKKLLPKHSAVFTWWDYGYALQDIPEFAIYHDGGRHGGISTYLVGKAFSMSSQEGFYNLLSFWEKFKTKEIGKIFQNSNTGSEFLKKLLTYKKTGVTYPTYILYTGDMIGKYGAISYFGNWDFNKNISSPDGYTFLRCSKIVKNILYCSNFNIDLSKGIITINSNKRKISLKQTLWIDNGYIVKNVDYKKNGIYLEILMKKRRIFRIMLLNNRLFSSNFNQQFLLGNVDKRYFQEVYNNFPVARAFKVLQRQ